MRRHPLDHERQSSEASASELSEWMRRFREASIYFFFFLTLVLSGGGVSRERVKNGLVEENVERA